MKYVFVVKPHCSVCDVMKSIHRFGVKDGITIAGKELMVDNLTRRQMGSVRNACKEMLVSVKLVATNEAEVLAGGMLLNHLLTSAESHRMESGVYEPKTGKH